MTKSPNIAFDADAVRRYIISCYVHAPCVSTRRALTEHMKQGAAALSKHLALPCAKCLRSRGVFLAATVLRLGFATMTLRLSPYPAIGGLPAIALLSLARRLFFFLTVRRHL